MLYKLKPGREEAYKKHSREVDYPTLLKQPGIRNYTVYEIKGGTKGGNGKSPYQIVEDIEVDSWDVWAKYDMSEVGRKLYGMWKEYCDETDQIIVYGDSI